MSEKIAIGVDIHELRPTQVTVGYREVELKRAEWRAAGPKARSKILRRHVVPAVLGPHDRTFIVDHHHFARALLLEEAGDVAIFVIDDLSHLPKDEFWTYLDNSSWCHAYDENGRRVSLDTVPASLADLKDDPFRSLAGTLIREGGCAKSARPFSEFLWADFLRRRIDKDLVEESFDKAAAKAMALARSEEARSLPGWTGCNRSGA